MLGLPIVEHAEDVTLTAGAEANEGLVATILGLKGWPAAAEISAVERAIAILDSVRADAPGARLHLTHLSTAGALDAVRRAKAAGLPVTCDVTPHHLGSPTSGSRARGAGPGRRWTARERRAIRGPTAPWSPIRTGPPAGSTRRSAARRTRRRAWRHSRTERRTRS